MGLRRVGALLTLCLLASCTSNVGQLELRLLRSPIAGEEPLTNVAAFVRIRIDGPDGLVGPVQFPVANRMGTLGDVPVGDGQVITVEGVGPEGTAVSRGRTAPMTIHSGVNAIDLFIGRLGFSQTPKSVAATGLSAPRAFHTATELANGELLLVGGVRDRWQPESGDPTPPPLASVERMDGNSLRFAKVDCGQAGSCLTHARVGHSTVLLPSGNVLVAGGRDEKVLVNPVEVFFAETQSFLVGPDLATPRAAHRSVVLGDSAVLAGGQIDPGLLTPQVETYAKGTLGRLPSLSTPRRDFAMVRLRDGTLFVSGGFDNLGAPLASTELLPTDAARWRFGPTLKVARGYHTATLLDDGDVLLIGGLTAAGQASDRIERFLVRDESLLELNAKLVYSRWGHTTTQLRDGSLLVVGGFADNKNGSPTPRVEEIKIYDTDNLGVAAKKFQLREPRAGHTATLLRNGWLLVAGGASIVCDSAQPPNCVEQPSVTAEVFVY